MSPNIVILSALTYANWDGTWDTDYLNDKGIKKSNVFQ